MSSCLSLTTALVLASALPWFAGCASVMPPSPPPSHGAEAGVAQHAGEDTEARAKRVFVFESRVADALMDRYPLREDFEAAEPDLVKAEAHMTDACGPLTRAVVRDLEGRKQSIKHKLKVARSLDDCETAARRVGAMLELPPSGGLVATGGP
jgi:hypothetical protein